MEKSISFLTLSSNQNHSDAQYTLGVIYYIGQGRNIDVEKAIHYFTISAKNGNKRGQLALGYIYYSGKNIKIDIQKAIYYLGCSAEKRSSLANFHLGQIYYDGLYIERDIKKAIYYFKEASNLRDSGTSEAKNNLGIIYKVGDGCDMNISRSIEYLTEAVKYNNDPLACYNLARIHFFEKNERQKAIDYLNMITLKDFFPKKIFLYFLGKYELDVQSFFCQKLYHFLNLYDYVYSRKIDYESDFFYYIKTGQFKQKKYDFIEKKNSRQININKLFYEGFQLKF